MSTTRELRRHALEIFSAALRAADAGEAVLRAVRLEGSLLAIADAEFDLRDYEKIYSIALGKAGSAMATALDQVLGERLAGGILSSTPPHATPPPRWRFFAGGHPLPNEASLAAAQASFDLLRRADDAKSLIIFLVSGGGSAMIESPREDRVTLADIRQANRILVTCGAGINEINAVRAAFSKVKAGGLSRCAPRAAQVTLIVSDTNTGEESSVASGPTFEQPGKAGEALSMIARYDLERRLPQSIVEAIIRSAAQPSVGSSGARRHFVLLDNRFAIGKASEAARARGFLVSVADEIVEQPVEEGSAKLVARLFELRGRVNSGETVCLISGGEFACPVKGKGVGGRNAETALRCAVEIDERIVGMRRESFSIVALSAGTDGIDGNSPAAGALATDTTIKSARQLNLDAQSFLQNSDAYNFFRLLGDEIVTGATGTNVRDLRIMLAR